MCRRWENWESDCSQRGGNWIKGDAIPSKNCELDCSQRGGSTNAWGGPGKRWQRSWGRFGILKYQIVQWGCKKWLSTNLDNMDNNCWDFDFDFAILGVWCTWNHRWNQLHDHCPKPLPASLWPPHRDEHQRAVEWGWRLCLCWPEGGRNWPCRCHLLAGQKGLKKEQCGFNINMK